MSIENSGNEHELDAEKTSKEISNHTADEHLVVNGISNGYGEKHSKKEHKSEHKDKDIHKEKNKHKDHKDRDKDKEKYRDKSSSGKDKEKHSSSSSKDKDKEKKHKDERREKNREHKSSSSSKDKEHRSSSSSKDKEKHSSSSSSNKEKDKDRQSSSHRDKEKEKDRHSLSSKEKDKHHSSSSSRDKEKHSSSSSEKKHSDKDKHRNKEREKDSKDKVKVKSGEHEGKKEKFEVMEEEENVVVKREPPEEVMTNENLINDSIESTADLSNVHIKSEEDTEEDVPLAVRATPSVKRRVDSDDEDIPLISKKKIKSEKVKSEPIKKRKGDTDEEEFKPEKKKKVKSKEVKVKKEISAAPEGPRKGRKKEEQQPEVWKWWEEEKKQDGSKWNFLEHKGPVFAPPYEKLPSDVKFFYNGKEMRLSEEAEEVATFYSRMLDHDYTTKEAFNTNFFKDWRKVMTSEEKAILQDLSKCNFKHMHAYFVAKTEERKAMSKEEKKKIKEQNEELVKDYGFCIIDGHKERIGNFRIEPPGLFRGRGEHPKMGMLKKRVLPEDVIINCSSDSVIPKPPDGRKWREVRHDKNVTWLASWTENVQGQVKYVMLNPSSKLKGEKDWQKYEVARKLAKSIDKIRTEYREDWRSKEMRIRQRSVALYFIDKLALRAGNEKDEDQADTVGCCSLRVEHISLHEQKDGKECVVVFDFLGKDSIRYYNEVSVEKRVFKNLQLFMQNKAKGDDLFDRLNTTVLNKHLNELMEGLTAKVFRTYNASITLQEQLKALTNPEYTVAEKILAYNRANRAVAILCNHQRAVPKTHAKSMENLNLKIEKKKEQIEMSEKQYKEAKREYKRHGTAKNKIDMDKSKKTLDRLREQLGKLEVQATDKEENKEIALGTSKLNYLDPRISVAWCKKFDVPIDKIYNKTQREKFRWAIDMAGSDYIF